MFDSSKKPKKGILKNRKFSGGDSGCALSDPKECELSLVSLQSALNDVISDTKSNKTQSIKTVLLKEDTTPTSSKRHSISSNSSTDMLDFSYDSSSSSNADPSPVCEIKADIEKSTTAVKKNILVSSPVHSTVVYSCSL